MARLQLCGTCERHVRDDEVSCPFCAAPMGKAPRRMITGPVLSRAALLVTTVATSFAAGGCGDDGTETSVANEGDEAEQKRPAVEARMALPAYGVVIDDGRDAGAKADAATVPCTTSEQR